MTEVLLEEGAVIWEQRACALNPGTALSSCFIDVI